MEDSVEGQDPVTHHAIKMLERNFAGQTITMLAIAGGPACDWERGELRNKFCPQYPRTRRCSSSSSSRRAAVWGWSACGWCVVLTSCATKL